MEWQTLLTRLQKLNPHLCRHLKACESDTLGAYADAMWAPSGRAARPSTLQHIAAAGNIRQQEYASIVAQLSRIPVVLTVHHTAPIFHPIALQTLLLAIAGHQPPRYLPVLATDWVPMDNLFHPRGILLRENGGLQSFNLFSKKCRKQLVSNTPGFTKPMVETLQHTILSAANKGALSNATAEKVATFLERFYLNETVLQSANYRHQCALINELVWRAIVPDSELLYINISDLILPLLIDSLQDQRSMLHALLFNAQIRASVLDVLDGVGGCWDSRAGSGSFFFWQQRAGKMYPLLTLDGNCLVNANGAVPLEPECILAGLRAGELLPGLFLIFAQLMFCDQLACIGGMRQIGYIAAMREGLTRVFRAHQPNRVEQLKMFAAERFAAGINALCIDSHVPATVFDLLEQPALLQTPWRDASLKEAVLNASDYLLELSR